MWLFILKCIYFMAPAYFANMAPVIAKNWLKFLAVPVDFGKRFEGKELFGSHKTFRGIIFGTLFAIVAAYLQFLLYGLDFFKSLSFIDYSNWLTAGFLLGFGALFGDLVKSFFKRRLDIKPGQRFFPWDQLDFVVGALVFASFTFGLTWKIVFYSIVVSVIGHIIINHSAYYLGIRKEKW